MAVKSAYDLGFRDQQIDLFQMVPTILDSELLAQWLDDLRLSMKG